MRKSLLASAAVLGMALALPAAGPAFAQNTATPPAAVTNGVPGAMNDGMQAGGDARPEEFLRAAQLDVQHHRGTAAQEALERAETRLLDRSTLASRANQPDSAPAVQEIAQAIDSVGKHDWQAAGQHIDAALHAAQMAQSDTMPAGNGGGMPHPGMNITAAPGAGAAGTVATPAAMGATPMPGDMTAGQSSVPMGAVLPPNGGVMAPSGGVMPPNPQ